MSRVRVGDLAALYRTVPEEQRDKNSECPYCDEGWVLNDYSQFFRCSGQHRDGFSLRQPYIYNVVREPGPTDSYYEITHDPIDNNWTPYVVRPWRFLWWIFESRTRLLHDGRESGHSDIGNSGSKRDAEVMIKRHTQRVLKRGGKPIGPTRIRTL